jgi:hypothetical protein
MKTVVLVITQRVTYRREFGMADESYSDHMQKMESLSGLELSRYEERFAETHIHFADDWYDACDTEIIEFMEVQV